MCIWHTLINFIIIITTIDDILYKLATCINLIIRVHMKYIK